VFLIPRVYPAYPLLGKEKAQSFRLALGLSDEQVGCAELVLVDGTLDKTNKKMKMTQKKWRLLMEGIFIGRVFLASFLAT
jgi:hypothetical protein